MDAIVYQAGSDRDQLVFRASRFWLIMLTFNVIAPIVLVGIGGISTFGPQVACILLPPMLFFYFWNDITATATRSAVMKYRCERCEELYCFEGQVTVSATGHSALMVDDEGAAQRAKYKAKEKARRAIQTHCFPVPCPACGAYQRAMGRVLGRQMYHWMVNVALALIAFSPFAFLLVFLVARSGGAAPACARHPPTIAGWPEERSAIRTTDSRGSND